MTTPRDIIAALHGGDCVTSNHDAKLISAAQRHAATKQRTATVTTWSAYTYARITRLATQFSGSSPFQHMNSGNVCSLSVPVEDTIHRISSNGSPRLVLEQSRQTPDFY